MMRIRPLLESDLSLVRTWMRDAPEAPAWSDDQLFQLVKVASGDERKTRRAWVADEETELVGFVVATSLTFPDAPGECELELVLVPPRYRRRGIGSALVQSVLAWAHGLGATELWLEVRQSNERAIRLYEKCDFIIAGRRPSYYVDPIEDAVLMRCRIEPGSVAAPV
jgi:[ribosomal protein S18]-alanine N-acetyltransferase